MPLYLYHRPSFNRSVKRLGANQKKIIGTILEALDTYYESGIEGNMRVVLRREGNNCIALLAGNHDQIEKFLSQV